MNIPEKYKDSIKICFSCDNNYAKYLAVTIKSVIENANKNCNYEIYIFDENISEYNKKKIFNMSISNIYIYFININRYIESIDKNIFYISNNEHRNYTISAYYRFFIPRIFSKFNRILYLDCDLIILNDLVELFNSKELDKKLMLVTKDLGVFFNKREDKFNSDWWNDYLDNVLKLKNSNNYFQSGVILFNINKCIDYNLEYKLLDKLNYVKPLYVDQDILNIVCEDEVGYLDLSYNVEWFISFYIDINYVKKNIEIKECYETEFLPAFNNPKILHYCSHHRPWNRPDLEKSDIWWQYARQTPFYEEIIYQNTNIQNIQNISYSRFSIADFLFSVLNNYDFLEICILGIRIKIKKKKLTNDKYDFFIDRIFSIYKNEKYKRITILGIKITKKYN